MRPRLFPEDTSSEADIRPGLLGIVTLLFLLLFFLLSTSSGQRLGTLALRFGTTADLAPLPHTGLLQSLHVGITAGVVTIDATVQSTDIAASAITTEARHLAFPARPDGSPDLRALEGALVDLHALDPSQERAVVAPGDDVSTADLLTVLDAVRGDGAGPRFPQVALAAPSTAPAEASP